MGFERVISLEAQFGEPLYTPFAQDFITQAKRLMARAESSVMAGSQRVAVQHQTAGRQRDVVQEQFNRHDEALNDFHALTDQRSGLGSR